VAQRFTAFALGFWVAQRFTAAIKALFSMMASAAEGTCRALQQFFSKLFRRAAQN